MIRSVLTAAMGWLALGAARAPTVDYRLGVDAGGGAPVLTVEMRLRGDPDGETRLQWPKGASEPSISGARSQPAADGARLLRHRAGAKIAVRYRLAAATGGSQRIIALGEAVFATPSERPAETAQFRWGRAPKGWRTASDLEHGGLGRAMSVADIAQSVVMAGPDLEIVETTGDGGRVRAAAFGDAAGAWQAAEAAEPLIHAYRAYWGDAAGPFLLALGGPNGPTVERGDALVLPPMARTELRREIASGLAHVRIPRQIGRLTGASDPATWLTEGLADVLAIRIGLRAGLGLDDAVGQLDALDRPQDPAGRGALLALKWDEEIRRKTAGRADLDDVVLRMRDHYRQFPAGQGPDVVTGLVSAAWVVARVDLRPDIAKYATGAAAIPLPEQMFDGCLDARVVVSPGFDSVFDHVASAAAKVAKGVRRRGPAWNSGLRDGMRIDAMALTPGDMTREVALTVRPARGTGKPRKLRYWPYGDADVEARTLQLAGLSGQALAACGRKIGGL